MTSGLAARGSMTIQPAPPIPLYFIHNTYQAAHHGHFLIHLNYMNEDIKNKPGSYWKEKLTPEEYQVLREQGTEAAFTGKYWDNHETGMYACAACGQELFSSKTKFDSGSGWPSFDDPINAEHIELIEDTSHGMRRTEVKCKNCGSHLGHMFDDGPTRSTGKRYCINSCSLNFQEKDQA